MLLCNTLQTLDRMKHHECYRPVKGSYMLLVWTLRVEKLSVIRYISF